MMYIYKLINKLAGCNRISNVRYKTTSFYDVVGPKHTSRHDYSYEIDKIDSIEKSIKPNTILGFLKSPEYQILRAKTPSHIAILDSFYRFSPPIKFEKFDHLKLDKWTGIELIGYHKLTDFLWYLGINNILTRDEIERLSYNFSISDLSINDAIKMILIFEGLKGPLNVCSLTMYEHLFHERPITTQELLSLAYALGKVRHSIDTLILPLVSILHKSSLKLDERIMLFLAISRLEPNINLIEFYTFTSYNISENDHINSLLQIINMDIWDQNIKKNGYVDAYNPDDYPVDLSNLQIFQLINGLSNITLGWLIGSVHKRIELKRLWNSNIGNEIKYNDKIFTYRNPLMAFCKILLNHLNKSEFNVMGFYIYDSGFPMNGLCLAHALNLIDQIDPGENSHFSKISSLAHRLTPNGISDIVEFIKVLKYSDKTAVSILESFIINMEMNSISPIIDNLKELEEIMRLRIRNNSELSNRVTKAFERFKLSNKVHSD